MAKANAILLNSVIWNLREVSKLAEKVKKHCGDVECTSWRYPTMSCSDLNIFKLLQNNKNLDNYTYILELTYDRLLYLFNLFIKYLESSESLEKFRPNKNVYRPKTLSLASVLHMIWIRLQALKESRGDITSEDIREDESEKELATTNLVSMKNSAFTQSEICSITLCSCCEMVQTFMTQLVMQMERTLEKHDIKSSISNERKTIRECLTQMTNWAVTRKLLSAISDDFTSISEELEGATKSSRKLKKRILSGEKKTKLKQEQLEDENRKLQAKLREYDSENLKLKHKISELDKEKGRLTDSLNSLTSKLSRESLDYDNKLSELKKSYEEMLKENAEMLLKKEKEKAELDEKLKLGLKELEEMVYEIQKLETTVSQLKEEKRSESEKYYEHTRKLQRKLKAFENEILCLKDENDSLNVYLENNEQRLKEYSRRLSAAFPELNNEKITTYKVTGNPEIDMTNQIEANKLKIELLKTENDNLQRIVNKIKYLKG